MQITRTSSPIGAVVTNLEIDKISSTDAATLNDAWLKYAVLVFSGMPQDVSCLVKVSQIFGDTVLHPMEELRSKTEPKVIVVAANGGCAVRPDDAAADDLIGYIPWHTDLVYTDTMTRGALLSPVIIPKRGGETGWIDTARVYGLLPTHIKEKIDRLQIIHSYEKAYSAQTMTAGVAKRFSDVIHPLVYRHPTNGDRVLNISPTSAKQIVGLGDEESEDLLSFLIDFACREDEAYVHHWQMGDIVLWDNWRTMHKAFGHRKRFPRVMHRTTLASKLQLGRWVLPPALPGNSVAAI